MQAAPAPIQAAQIWCMIAIGVFAMSIKKRNGVAKIAIEAHRLNVAMMQPGEKYVMII
jgi:hypothetical protein